MRKVNLISLILLISQPVVAATNNSAINKKSCAKVGKKIAIIHNKMRTGYTAAQGNRFNEQLRQLKNKRDKCKKKKYDTIE